MVRVRAVGSHAMLDAVAPAPENVRFPPVTYPVAPRVRVPNRRVHDGTADGHGVAGGTPVDQGDGHVVAVSDWDVRLPLQVEHTVATPRVWE